jgi:protein-S-isoprenylcysteine O-methyltransferase Ste14
MDLSRLPSAAKTLAFLALVPGTVVVSLPAGIGAAAVRRRRRKATVARYLAPFAWAAGGLLLLASTGLFVSIGRGTPSPADPPRELVVQGPYNRMRNPMYVGALLILMGHFLWFQTRWLLAYAGALWAAFHSFVVLYEEPTLLQRHGEAYAQYVRRVPRWLPALGRRD